MFVSCLFHKDEINGYAGRAYTYETDLPLRKNDKVMLPTKDGDKRGLVVMTDLPRPAFECKKIVAMDMGKENSNE